GPADVVAEQLAQLSPECGILAELEPCRGELVEGRHEHLRHVSPSESPEPPPVLCDRRLDSSSHSRSWSCAETPLTGARSPLSCRSLAAGFFARINASPIRMAWAPAWRARSTCARVEIPLSNTTVRSLGIRPASSSARSSLTSSDSRSR